MCGIVACLSENCTNCVQSTVLAIEQLQNRGNDSYGIGGIDQHGQIKIDKVANLARQTFTQTMRPIIDQYQQFHLMFAHSRWATHGSNTDYNAHPHLDYSCHFAIIHNGTIENYQALKLFLVQHQIKLISDTDTEILLNLISYHYHYLNQNCPDQIDRIRLSITSACHLAIGTWACVLISKYTPDTLWCFRHFCPLILAWNQKQTHILAISEQSGLDQSVDQFAVLENDKIYAVQLQKIDQFQNVSPIKHNHLHCSTPYPFEHWMLKEIYDQQLCLTHLVQSRTKNHQLNFPELLPHFVAIQQSSHLLLIGCGTSYYAGKFAKHFFHQNQIFCTVQCLDASEFDLSDIPYLGSTVAILISQSGETMDLIRVQQQLNQSGILNLAITNVPNSTIQREASVGILTESGKELAVASTKSYSAQIIMLQLISLWLNQELNRQIIIDQFDWLNLIGQQIEQVIKQSNSKLLSWAEQLAKSQNQHLFILGKKNSYSLAKEASLKLKEIAYIHAESYSASALKHGPYSLIEPGNPIIFVLSRQDTNSSINNTISEIRSRGAIAWVITDWEIKIEADDVIYLPYNPLLYGILHIIPFQLLAYYVAIKKKHNPDYPRNLAKSVTVD